MEKQLKVQGRTFDAFGVVDHVTGSFGDRDRAGVERKPKNKVWLVISVQIASSRPTRKSSLITCVSLPLTRRLVWRITTKPRDVPFAQVALRGHHRPVARFNSLFRPIPPMDKSSASEGKITPVTLVPIDSIAPAPWNPRTISDEDINGLKRSLADDPDFLWRRAPCVRKATMQIYAGCQRWLGCKKLGWTEIPCGIDDISEEEARIRSAKDNNHHGTDTDEHDSFLQGLGVDLSTIGSGISMEGIGDLQLGDIQEDEVPDPPKDPKRKLGDLYQLGDHRLLCGDATKKEDVERLMNGEKADMVFTDPPYGIDYVGGAHQEFNRSRVGKTIQNDMDTSIFDKAFDNYMVRDGASFYVCSPTGENLLDFLTTFLRRCHLSSTLVWAKDRMTFSRCDYHMQHEIIIYGWDKRGSHNWYGDRTHTSVWNIERPTTSKEHPTMKPIALCAKAIQNSSKIMEIILDLFGGSGSTLIACEQLKRKCYMMEIDPHYTDVILERWSKFTGKDPIRLSDQKLWSKIKT